MQPFPAGPAPWRSPPRWYRPSHRSSSSRQPAAPRRALAQPGGAGATADVVVDFADGRVQVARVGLSQAPIPTGLTLLGGSGLAVTRNGGMVCAIQGVGCPADDCFCACRDPQKACAYWAYHLGRPDGGWDVAQTGPADRTVAAGAVDGWVWGGDRPPVTATLAMRASLIGVEWLRRHQTARGGIADHVGFTTEAVLAARGRGSTPRRGGRAGTAWRTSSPAPPARTAPAARRRPARRWPARRRRASIRAPPAASTSWTASPRASTRPPGGTGRRRGTRAGRCSAWPPPASPSRRRRQPPWPTRAARRAGGARGLGTPKPTPTAPGSRSRRSPRPARP